MAANDDFRKKFEAFVGKAKSNQDQVVRKVAFELFRSLVLKSPVGNPDLWEHPVKGYVGGRFRGNWQVQDNLRPVQLDIEDKSGAATLNAGLQDILRFKIGGTLFLVNHLPYAVPLEYGHSKQAPAGMVRITVTEFDQFLTKAVGDLKT